MLGGADHTIRDFGGFIICHTTKMDYWYEICKVILNCLQVIATVKIFHYFFKNVEKGIGIYRDHSLK